MAATPNFAKAKLKSFVERVEKLEEEKKAISEDIREVYAEAKGDGFDVKALRAVIRMYRAWTGTSAANTRRWSISTAMRWEWAARTLYSARVLPEIIADWPKNWIGSSTTAGAPRNGIARAAQGATPKGVPSVARTGAASCIAIEGSCLTHLAHELQSCGYRRGLRVRALHRRKIRRWPALAQGCSRSSRAPERKRGAARGSAWPVSAPRKSPRGENTESGA